MKRLSPTHANGQNEESFSPKDARYAVKVAFVDDDENDLLILRHLLQQFGEFVCVGAYRSANEALEGIPKVRPRVVLIDIRMPGMDGHECARRLKIISPKLKIVFVTALQDLDTVNRALLVGTDGYLTKPVSAAQCLAVLKLALCRTTTPSRETCAFSGSEVGSPQTHSLLTWRENQVMKLFAKGLLSKEIADQLGISFAAVHKHQLNSYRKLGAHTRTEALNKWWAIDGT